MYSITSRDRRVTNYVKKQAYKWLYTKIVKNEYESHSNEADNVLLRIRQQKAVTPETYEEFLDYCNNDPYYYMINHDRPKKLNGITTRIIDNYFVEFNDVLLPVGFIKEFFEDDYETMMDIREFYKTYLDGTLDSFFISCQMTRNRRDEEIEAVKQKNSRVFNTKFGHHFVNIFIRFILPLVAIFFGLRFFIGTWLADGFTQVTEENSVEIALNAIGVLMTFLPALRAISLLVFYIRWISIRIYVSGLSKALDVFDSDTMDSFKEHFRNINQFLIQKPFPVIEDDPCFEDPQSKKQYLYIVDFNKKTLEDKLASLMKRFKFKVNVLTGHNKWFMSLINNFIWAAILVMVNTPSLKIWVDVAMEWLDKNVF